MTIVIPNLARAYVNYGRWIAECPSSDGGALELDPHQGMFNCPECKALMPIEWPYDADAIWNELEKRPAARNRNWFPSGHDLALRSGRPHGQTIDELREEAEANGVDCS